MASLYFHIDDTVYESDLWEQREKPEDFLHSFGGSPNHTGIIYSGCPKPPHLLYTLDLTDPKVHIEIPGVRWLPLFYAFQYDASPLYYRVLSDHEVQIVRQERTSWTDDFPYRGYPAQFPFYWVQVTVPRMLDDHLDDLCQEWEELVVENAVSGVRTDHNDLIALVAVLWQGAPKTKCLNPSCQNQSMDVFAIIRHDIIEGLSLWGPDGDAAGVKIAYEMCPKCQMIYVSNQYT